MRLFTVKTPSECIYNVQEGGSRAPGPMGEKNYTPLYSAASHASIHSFVGFSGLQGQVQERSTHKEALQQTQTTTHGFKFSSNRLTDTDCSTIQ